MEIKEYVIGATAGVLATSAVVWFLARGKEEAPKAPPPPKPEPDIEVFKQTMEERYDIPEDVKVSAEVKKILIKGIHDGIRSDISKLYAKQYHKDLNAYNSELFKKHS